MDSLPPAFKASFLRVENSLLKKGEICPDKAADFIYRQ